MNKKILVYYSQLNMGGAEKSLVRLMNRLAAEGCSVTYLGRFGHGSCEALLSPDIRKIYLSEYPPAKGSFFKRAFSMVRAAFQRWRAYLKLRFAGEHYDLAFVGLQGLAPWCVCKLVKARVRAVFIRTDISRCPTRERIKKAFRKYGSSIDRFICVAGTVKESFDRELPELSGKSQVIYNFLDVDAMHRAMAEAENPFEPGDDSFKIVSVCRVHDHAKGVFRMLNVCERLVKAGLRFKWYLVGDGPDLPALREEIRKRGMDKVFLTPGKKDNPFAYYLHADLVAVPSYYEGLCGIVNEAKVAGAAVAATEFSGIHEQITHGKNGVIFENSEDAIFEGLRELIGDPEKVRKLKNHLYPEAILDDDLKFRQICDLADHRQETSI